MSAIYSANRTRDRDFKRHTGHVEVEDIILFHDIVNDLSASFVDNEDFPLDGRS